MLMEKSRVIYSPDGLRCLTLETVIGFMAVTGVRTSEVVNLKLADVDFIDKIVLIRMGKNGKDRLLPLKDSVAKKLRQYRTTID
jgi:integrase